MRAADLMPRRHPVSGVQLPSWGVFCLHEQRWITTGLASEKEAWWALLETDSLHPRELIVKGYGASADDEVWVKCSACSGTGELDSCGQECPVCEGTGEVEGEP